MTTQPLKNLKAKVEFCLSRSSKARNSDVYLTQMIIYKYMPLEVQKIRGKWWFSGRSFYMVREDNVKRIRAKFQNHPTNPKYLPDDPKVRKARNINEETWRNFLGYNPELREIL